MNSDQTRMLWARFLAGESLSPAEERELAEALESDPVLRNELLEDSELDGSLRGWGQGKRHQESFARSFAFRMSASEENSRFLLRLEGRLASHTPEELGRLKDQGPWTAAAESRSPQATKRSLRRSTRRRVSDRPASYWIAWAAAALLFALPLFLGLGPSNSGSVGARRSKDVAKRTPIPEKPFGTQNTGEAGEREGTNPSEERRREMESRPRPDLSPPKRPLAEGRGDEEAREKALGERKVDQDRIEREGRGAGDQAGRNGAPALPATGLEAKPPPVRTPPGPGRETATQTSVARVEEVSGEAFLVSQNRKTPLAPGMELLVFEGLGTGTGTSRLVFRFLDQTRVELGPDTLLGELRLEKGKRLFIARGMARADVTPQPKEWPMTFATPHGEARVVGTSLRLQVDLDPRKGTRLDVDEGKVQFRNLAGKSVLVEGGHGAVAAEGTPLVSGPPLVREEVLLHYDFEDGRRPDEWDPAYAVVVPGPPRGTNRFCLQGREDARTSGIGPRIELESSSEKLRYQTGLVVRFRYFFRGKKMVLQVWNSSAGQNYHWNLPSPVQDQWAQGEASLDAFEGNLDRKRPLQPGDLLNLQFFTGPGDGPAFWDDIEVVRSPSKRR